MIVKNEEKVLERCLKSLQPLMRAIPSELIIADTGSTDSTVEIAKKYTENVFHFEWINDFAAARNSTLEKAKGLWYLFLDADEYLDTEISEVVDFFKSPDMLNQYKMAEINVRNYTDKAKREYADVFLPRFVNLGSDDSIILFTGAIHETIYIREPIYYFKAILHHTGYIYNSLHQNLKKIIRNHELMVNEYNNDPEDLRILAHLIDGSGLPNEDKEKETFISEALRIVRKDFNHLYSRIIYVQAISYYKNTNPTYALKLCSEYYEVFKSSEKYIATIAIKIYEAQIYYVYLEYDKAFKSLTEYFCLYDDYKNNKLNIIDMSVRPIEGINEQEYIRYKCMASIILGKMKKYNVALNVLSEFSVSEYDGENFKNILGAVREICQKAELYKVMATYHNDAMNGKSENKKNLSLYMMESTFYSIVDEQKRISFAKNIVESGIKTKYSELMQLSLSQDNCNFEEKLQEFVYGVDDWKEGYSEAIYLSIKHKIDISKAVDNMNSSEFRKKFEIIANHHDDFAEHVLEYGIPITYTNTIKRFYWITSMYEKASYRSFELNDQCRYALYLKFVELLGEYVSNIYNSELLQDENDVQVLPPLHKFGYYMLQADKALLNGDSIGYVRGMKKALQNCESMTEIVEFMLEQFKKKMGMN